MGTAQARNGRARGTLPERGAGVVRPAVLPRRALRRGRRRRAIARRRQTSTLWFWPCFFFFLVATRTPVHY